MKNSMSATTSFPFFKAKKKVTQSLCGDGGDGSRWAGGCLWGVGWEAEGIGGVVEGLCGAQMDS